MLEGQARVLLHFPHHKEGSRLPHAREGDQLVPVQLVEVRHVADADLQQVIEITCNQNAPFCKIHVAKLEAHFLMHSPSFTTTPLTQTEAFLWLTAHRPSLRPSRQQP